MKLTIQETFIAREEEVYVEPSSLKNPYTEKQGRLVDSAYGHLLGDGGTKMTSLRESAMAYEPPHTLNIANLESFRIDLEVKDGKGKDKDGVEFEYKYVEIDGKEYRIPGSVLGGIKAILQKMPQVIYMSVIKQGTGMNTKYQVIPIDRPIDAVKA